MKFISFDLSTTTTGVFIAEVSGRKVVKGRTIAIKPPSVSPEEVGYLKTKKKFNGYVSFVMNKDEEVSLTKKKSRDRIYKNYCERHRQNYMMGHIIQLLDDEKPSHILLEQNMSFRSNEVTRMLAEIAGGLKAVALSKGILCTPVNVHTARSLIIKDLNSAMIAFAACRTPAQLKGIDMTKEIFKEKMLELYKHLPLNPKMTTDESDAMVIYTAFFLLDPYMEY